MNLITEFLSTSSLSGARLGIDGLLAIPLFGLGLFAIISFLSRIEYSPPTQGILGVIILSYLASIFGAMVAHPYSALFAASFACGLASFLTSGPFLDFRLPHRLAIALGAPVIFIASEILSKWGEQLLLDNILK